MSRRFNFTGRRRLTRDCVSIQLHAAEAGEPAWFTAILDFPEALDLPDDAGVYVEAYVKTSVMRFDFGTVGAIRQPRQCRLDRLDHGGAILFRVKVVGRTGHVGRLLAVAKGLRPEGDKGPGGPDSLMLLRCIDLKEEVWRIDIDPDAGPTLCVNNRIPALDDRLTKDPLLGGTIFPQVVRRMVRAVYGPEAQALDDDCRWLRDWKRWLEQYVDASGIPDGSDDEDVLVQLADDAARDFAQALKFASRVVDADAGDIPA